MATLECACMRRLETGNDDEPCMAVGPFGYMCTEDRGHRSHHIACGMTDHFKEVWHDQHIAAAVAARRALDMITSAN